MNKSVLRAVMAASMFGAVNLFAGNATVSGATLPMVAPFITMGQVLSGPIAVWAVIIAFIFAVLDTITHGHMTDFGKRCGIGAVCGGVVVYAVTNVTTLYNVSAGSI